MSDPADHLKQADLDATLAAANAAVRANPADPKARAFLYQLNCVLGRWEKALDQLAIYAGLIPDDPDARVTTRLHQMAIQCEVFRAEVFAGKRTPLILGEPDQWLAPLMQANQLLAQGNAEAAAALRDQAFNDAPATSGKIDGKPFEWIADADTRLGPVIELHMEGKYYWVPMSRIKRIALEAPGNLIDLVFAPAQFVWSNGGEGAGFIPVRYAPVGEPNTAPDPKCALSRLTQWTDLPGNFTVGSGQRMFATDTDDISLLEVRVLDLSENK
ncbi:type VI secretion system accessory protein TagJ [Ereboglobus luteus]|uniref:Virulence protein SciE type n=1 Tax=Ereboglobus luteus TaxID=1796921 RepID=A0A2U8E5A3_9BACT|nr:type VI secretion system accessory protein TagJ [Ereboglobus luteus]AWI10031.1 hypothetical protein CKA38_12905 [Ereboglobus luteus]